MDEKYYVPSYLDLLGGLVGGGISLLLTNRRATQKNIIASQLSAFAFVMWVVPSLQEYYQFSIRVTSAISFLGGMCSLPIFSGLYRMIPAKVLNLVGKKEDNDGQKQD